MAVEHLVWFKFNDDVSEERMAFHVQELLGLKDKVPAIQEISAGINFTERSQGYQVGLRVLVEDREALKAYATHPDHVAVAGEIVKEAEVMALDYER